MLPKDAPIQRKLMTVILVTSGAVLLLTYSAYFAYEFITFRQTIERQLSTLGEIIATNSTAALAFDSREDAYEILSAVRADKHIVAAGLYDEKGNLFSYYPDNLPATEFPALEKREGYVFLQSHLIGFQPIVQGTRRLGTLYLKSDTVALSNRLLLYSSIALVMIVVSFLVAYLISKNLQKRISTPILALAETAKAISDRQDYSVRAQKLGDDELGLLTDAFNQMLGRIHRQNEEITLFNQNLEQKVAERTNDMELANKELEAFSYSVSHDLRAPLRSIHGYMNIFSEEYADRLDEEAKRLIGIVLRNSHMMGKLIDDLLAFSQLGRKELTKSRVQMKSMVTVIWEDETRMETNRHIRFNLQELPPAYADSNTIKQVWSNLISNAIKYSRKSKDALIEIGFEDNGDMLIYHVKDNGAGFDMQYYNKLFGVFQRLHSQHEFDGTGVGLAIVQRIISKHGGKVWATSKINEGATFYFSLPKN